MKMKPVRVHPNFWRSEQLGRVSIEAKLIYIGLGMMADRYARAKADPRLIGACLLPFDDAATDLVTRALEELQREQLIQAYMLRDSAYVFITEPGRFLILGDH